MARPSEQNQTAQASTEPLANAAEEQAQPVPEASVEASEASPETLLEASGVNLGVNWSEQVALLRGLAAIVRDEELSELMLEQAGVRLSLRSRRPSIVPPEPALPAMALPLGASLGSLGVDMALAEGIEAPEEEAEVPEEEAPGTPIVSPMVGSFWSSKSPDDPPFVKVGDHVEIGQVIGLVEAMKTFNEIQSEVEGEVVAIPAHNNELVEAGQPLVVVR